MKWIEGEEGVARDGDDQLRQGQVHQQPVKGCAQLKFRLLFEYGQHQRGGGIMSSASFLKIIAFMRQTRWDKQNSFTHLISHLCHILAVLSIFSFLLPNWLVRRRTSYFFVFMRSLLDEIIWFFFINCFTDSIIKVWWHLTWMSEISKSQILNMEG